MNEIRNLNVDNGIGSLLDFLTNVDNSPIKRMSEKKPEKEENKIDFAGLWNRSSDEEKLTFFKRHDESQCPASTKFVARDYFRKLGLDHTKLMKW
jgi:U3 small nucleolar ribonucleoprotein component